MSKDSLKISDNKKEETFKFFEIGFEDYEHPGEKDDEWYLLLNIAARGGTLSWDKKDERIKHQIVVISRRLQHIVGINDFPFNFDSVGKKITTKFTINKIHPFSAI
jgi:hypothetical protein